MSSRTWGILLLGSLVACGSRKPAPEAPARWVQVASPVQVEQAESYPLSGTVVPQGGAQPLSFLVPGRVVTARVREGEAVAPGQVLATLETTSYAAGLEAARAQTRAARAAALRAEDELGRMRILHDRQSLAENDFRKFELAGKAALEQANQAQASETVAAKALADTTLRAFSAGVVTRRFLEPGMMVAAGQPVIETAAMDPVEIQVGIPENLVGFVRVGQAAKVTVPALPELAFTGVLKVLNASADPASRTYMARIAVRNPKGQLRLGMVTEARIQGDRKERMLLVPCDAVVKDPQGATLVFELRPGEDRVTARRVTLGALDGRAVQVKAGLDGASPIVVAGQNFLRDGSRVQVESASRRGKI